MTSLSVNAFKQWLTHDTKVFSDGKRIVIQSNLSHDQEVNVIIRS